MSDATTPSTPRPLRHAATILVLRQHGAEIEVLMTRRHANLAFMGGLWVFPGGALAPADHDPAARELIRDGRSFELHDFDGERVSHATSLALALAACRETFEEAGVLLASRPDGSPPHEDQLIRLAAQRAKIAADPTLFVPALQEEGLRLDFERMIYWAHWITPSASARRFDTRFFLARSPATHAFAADTFETTECMWIAPALLLENAARSEMRIALPTRYNLEVLRASIEQHGSLDALLTPDTARAIPPIMPKLVKHNDQSIVVMPWDKDYEALPGEGLKPRTDYDPSLLRLPSRGDMDH
jgi:8-oxo-dGTP pyrophosphatase MutT (NUDIX family)